MFQRLVCCVLFSVFCVPAVVCPVCFPCMLCGQCASCVPYALGIGCILCVFAVRCVLCLAPSLHPSVTQSGTCFAFISHKNYVARCVHDTILSRFRPFSCTPGLIIQCPSHSFFITVMETPVHAYTIQFRLLFVFLSLFLYPGADYTVSLAHPLYNVLGNPDL